MNKSEHHPHVTGAQQPPDNDGKDDGKLHIEDSASKEAKRLRFEDVISGDFLFMLSKSAGGFRFMPDPNLPPGQVGYTNKQTRVIYYNPAVVAGNPERGIPPWTPEQIKGFTFHESGHHAPEVLLLDDRMIADISNPEVIIPERMRNDIELSKKFAQAIYRGLMNAMADIWLESFMGRRPFVLVDQAITELQKSSDPTGPWSLKKFPLPEQLMQIVLRSRGDKNDTTRIREDWKDQVDPLVYETYLKIMKSFALEAVVERKAYERVFASELDKKRLLERKFAAYREHFLPAYQDLFMEEARRRAEEKKKESSGESGESGENSNSDSEGGESSEDGGEPGKDGKPGKSGKKGLKDLSKEEKEAVEEIVKEILKEADEHGCSTQEPGEGEKAKKLGKAMEGLGKMLEEMKKEGGTETKRQVPNDPKGLKGLEDQARKLNEEYEKSKNAGLAGKYGVSQESIASWKKIKTENWIVIEQLANRLANVFLEDRRKRIEYLKREGEIVPGLESETISAILSGDRDPKTRSKITHNPEFLSTDLEFIFDTSGSMSGAPITRSIETAVIITEAFKRVLELLEDEGLVAEGEKPFRLGAVKFSSEAEIITKLDDDLDDLKELRVIDKASDVGGGTDESVAIASVREEFRSSNKNTIKIAIIFTDGFGNKAAVAPLMAQIEQEGEIVFAAVGFAKSPEEAQAIIDTYVSPTRGDGSVTAFPTTDPATIVTSLPDFIAREVEKRKVIH